MRRLRESMRAKVICAGVVMLLAGSPVVALPPDPDNAALLYYQAFLTVADLEDEAREHISNVATGKAAPDEKVREYIDKCRIAIEFVEAAAEVPACHWGFRFSQGFDAQMPQLARVRFLAFLLAADARLRASDGDYRGAMERCLLMDSVARHVGDDTLISYLVALAVRGLRHKCMQDEIGRAADDGGLLRWLKNELVTSGPMAASPVRPLKIEMQTALDTLRMENIDQYARLVAGEDQAKQAEILAKASEEICEQARQIYEERVGGVLTVMGSSLPYDQAHARIKELTERFDPNDPASAAVGALVPALAKILTLKVRDEAHTNAIKAGVEICLARAETGQLPEALPPGLAKDPFAGQDFEYKVTAEGFVLRCRAPDLDKNETYEYAFKLAR